MVLVRCPICIRTARIARVEFKYYKDVEDATKIVYFECMNCDKPIAAQVELHISEPIVNTDWVDYSKLSGYLKGIQDSPSGDAKA